MIHRKHIKRIAVNTGGGDAPGLNAVIRAVVLSARKLGWDVIGIKRGYEGLIDISQTVELTEDSVRGITHLGGTILGTSNKGNPFEFTDALKKVISNFNKLKLDCLVAIGGDGSLRIAHKLSEMGIPVVGVPKTIDNDVSATDVTFGFDTAVTTAAEALDKLHPTAEAHSRVMVVEVMGRNAGWIALHAGVSSSADVILIPEIPYDIEKICRKILERDKSGRHYSLVVVAEGAKPKNGEMVSTKLYNPGGKIRIGGISIKVAEDIAKITSKETRVLVLGHLQRGGSPSTFDRLLALRFGAAAVRAIQNGKFGSMVALEGARVKLAPLKDAIAVMKSVPLDCDTISTAHSLGICLGD